MLLSLDFTALRIVAYFATTSPFLADAHLCVDTSASRALIDEFESSILPHSMRRDIAQQHIRRASTLLASARRTHIILAFARLPHYLLVRSIYYQHY